MMKKTAAALFALLFALSLTSPAWAAKNAVTDWSIAAASNTDVGGINIQGSAPVSNGDDAIREMMEQIAVFITAAVFTGTTPITMVSTDAGATAQPILALYRNSISPLASDIIGKILFQGEDSAGNTEDYSEVYTVITDPTSTNEDADILIRHKIAGTMTTAITVSAANITAGKPVVLSSGATATGSATAASVTASGTSIAFSSLPASIKRFVISFTQLSTTGTTVPELQLGDSGGLENSGYAGAVTNLNETGPVITTTQLSTGFSLAQGSGWAGAVVMTGQIECIRRASGDHVWMCKGQMVRTDADFTILMTGAKTLSAELDRMSILFGADTADNGTAGLWYEY